MSSLGDRVEALRTQGSKLEGVIEDSTRGLNGVELFLNDLKGVLGSYRDSNRKGARFGEDEQSLIISSFMKHIGNLDTDTIQEQLGYLGEVQSGYRALVQGASEMCALLEGITSHQEVMDRELRERLAGLAKDMRDNLHNVRTGVFEQVEGVKSGIASLNSALTTDRQNERQSQQDRIDELSGRLSEIKEEQETYARERLTIKHPLFYTGNEGMICGQAMDFPDLKSLILMVHDGRSLTAFKGDMETFAQEHLLPIFEEKYEFLRGYGLSLPTESYNVLSGITNIPFKGEKDRDQQNSAQVWASGENPLELSFHPGSHAGLSYSNGYVRENEQGRMEYRAGHPMVMLSEGDDLMIPGKALDSMYAIAKSGRGQEAPSAQIRGVALISSINRTGRHLVQITSEHQIRQEKGNIYIGDKITFTGGRR